MRSKKTVIISAFVPCASATTILRFSVFFVFLGAGLVSAQVPMSGMPNQQGSTDSASQDRQMADQIAELRRQVARLQAAVQKTGSSSKASGMKMAAPRKGMAMMGDKGEMSMAPKDGMPMNDDGEMGGMSPVGNAPMAPGMSMSDDAMGGMPMGGKGSASPSPAMGMCCGRGAAGPNATMSALPGSSGGMAPMSSSSSAMPGQAGASHIYHIGSNGFFLNHSRHITLTQDQRLTLNHLKEKAMLDSAYEQRRIEQGEQELYALTGADQPDNGKIQGKISEIERLRATERMNFIHSVEEASNVLTPEQRRALLGTMPTAKR